MGNYDHSVQQNIERKFSQYGMGARAPAEEANEGTKLPEKCDSVHNDDCIRSMEYLRRIVKSLMRQMNVHSHVFGPGEAITIDLQAELKYDDYVVLSKFTNTKSDFDKYLYRIDEIMSNFIHVVDHSSSRFDLLDSIVNFPAFYSLKFWVILSTSMVICSLIILLLVKAFNSRKVYNQLIYGFVIIFILSCVWSYSSMYEDKKAEIMSHMAQSNGLPPKDCDYQNWSAIYSAWYWIRVHVSTYKDQCGDYYRLTMTDPFWKVNPLEAISTSVAYFFFTPMEYIGTKLGGFYAGFFSSAHWLMKPVMIFFALVITVLIIIGPFRISTPILTLEPAWRPHFPALDRSPGRNFQAIRHSQVRNEIMERPDGPVIKSVRDATTDMDGFQEFLTDEGSDELIIGPFARFNSINEEGGISSRSDKQEALVLPTGKEQKSQTGIVDPEEPISYGSASCNLNEPSSQSSTVLKDHVLGNDFVEEDLLNEIMDALKEDKSKDIPSPIA